MREVFLEPLPAKPLNATLLFGRKPVSCYIIAVTEEGYCVGVPGIEQYEGDPRLTLATEEEVIPVKLVLQESHLDGYYFWLIRQELVERSDQNVDWKIRSRKILAQYGLPSVAAAILAICLVSSGNSEGTARSSFSTFRAELLSWCKPVVKDNDATSPAVEADQIAVTKLPAPQQIQNKNIDRTRPSLSLISPASLSSSPQPGPAEEIVDVLATRREEPDNTQLSSGPSPAETPTAMSLKGLLEAGQVGRVQTITRCLVPWLFERKSNEASLSIRMSDAAWLDLKQFEYGLRNLPQRASADAIARLRESLDTMATDIWKAKQIHGMSNMYVVASKDANLYFQIVRGRVELVRVLPIDFKSEG